MRVVALYEELLQFGVGVVDERLRFAHSGRTWLLRALLAVLGNVEQWRRAKKEDSEIAINSHGRSIYPANGSLATLRLEPLLLQTNRSAELQSRLR